MLPYAIGEIIRSVTVAHTNSGEIFATVKQPLTFWYLTGVVLLRTALIIIC